MIIKGIQKTSLLDYPGKISSVVFTPGCNFRCPFCHNPDLVENSPDLETIKEKELLEFLEERKKWIDGLVITGGEPCLQNDLPEFVRKVKETGLFVKLDTNGSLPDMLKRLIDNGNLDYIAMDIKAPLNPKAYRNAAGVDVDIEKIKRSIGLILGSGKEHEFRSTVLPRLHAKEDVVEMAKAVGGTKRYYIQQFRPLKTLDPAFTKSRRFNTEELEWMKRECSKYVPTDIRR